MAITLPSVSGNLPISVDLMNQYYDNKTITPRIRAALQKREDEEAAKSPEEKAPASSSANSSKFGPATRVDITDQIVRMNIANNSTKTGKKEDAVSETGTKKPSRYDVLTEVKKSVAEREAAARKEKDDKLKEIADKVAAGNSSEG
ncbi:hypothetical protein R83H12_02071 [Fibrobacteria bacterium R8-3-H12]